MLNFGQTNFRLNIYALISYGINLVDVHQSCTHPNMYVSISEQQNKPNITKQSSFCVRLE